MMARLDATVERMRSSAADNERWSAEPRHPSYAPCGAGPRSEFVYSAELRVGEWMRRSPQDGEIGFVVSVSAFGASCSRV